MEFLTTAMQIIGPFCVLIVGISVMISVWNSFTLVRETRMQNDLLREEISLLKEAAECDCECDTSDEIEGGVFIKEDS